MQLKSQDLINKEAFDEFLNTNLKLKVFNYSLYYLHHTKKVLTTNIVLIVSCFLKLSFC